MCFSPDPAIDYGRSVSTTFIVFLQLLLLKDCSVAGERLRVKIHIRAEVANLIVEVHGTQLTENEWLLCAALSIIE